jgi:PAS domain S-box-containing protein
MIDNLISLLKETKELTNDKDQYYAKLHEALEIIQAIQQGNIDAVFMVNHETAKVLVPKTADQSYRKFIEEMQEGVVTLLDDGVILYSNNSFSKIVGTSLENVIGSNIRSFIPVEYMETFERFFDGLPLEDSKVNISMTSATGTKGYYVVSLSMLPLQKFTALNLVWTNITELTEAKEQLTITNEKLKLAIKEKIISETRTVILNNKLTLAVKDLKDLNLESASFAHIASEDLQQPLRKLLTYSSLLVRDYFHTIDLQGRKYVDIMIDASVKMRDLINDIVDYSELSQNIIKFGPTDLQVIINDVVANLKDTISATGAKIVIENELPVVEADFGQMIQLFQNLMTNSLKFIFPGAKPDIHIRFDITSSAEVMNNMPGKSDYKFCRIYIMDHGIGFDPKFKERIFVLFQRLNNIKDYPGTGIGLAICKKVIQRHHGSITAKGMPGMGAVFTITLPLAQL